MAGRPRGLPKTGGRKRGTPNKRTIALQQAMAATNDRLAAALGSDAFEGDSLALLASIYRDTRQPTRLRLDAAKAALPFERPRLATVEPGDPDAYLDAMSDDELEAEADRLLVEHRKWKRQQLQLEHRRAPLLIEASR